MSNKKRDYAAEYKRRIARGKARGLSLSQARGHPKANENYVGKSKPIADNALQISLKYLREGNSLSDAAKEIRVSPQRLRNQAKQLGAIRKKGNRWIVKNTLPRKMLIYTDGEALPIIIGKFHYASKLGRYMAGVKQFSRTNDIKHLKPFIGKSIKDQKNKIYIFETNPNSLYRIATSGNESFEQVYRIII
jgi:hypothetical protein